jgi:hypothetical protein
MNKIKTKMGRRKGPLPDIGHLFTFPDLRSRVAAFLL